MTRIISSPQRDILPFPIDLARLIFGARQPKRCTYRLGFLETSRDIDRGD
jgi:hypothetical protein